MCYKCQTNPVYEFTNKHKLCKVCFIRWFQKKFLYTIRRFKLIEKGDVICYKQEKNFRGKVLEKLLKFYSKKTPIKLIKGLNKHSTKFADSSTADSKSYEIVSGLFNGNLLNIKFIPKQAKIISPLCLFLDKEVFLYAKLTNITFKKEINKKNNLNDFVDELEKKHPEIKQAIISGWMKLNKID